MKFLTILLSIVAIFFVLSLLWWLFEINRRATRRKMLKKYQEFFDEMVNTEDVNGKLLSEDKRRAVGQKILRDLIEKACARADIPEDERLSKRLEFEKYFKEKLPDILDNTPYIYTGSGFVEKKTN